MLKSNAYILVTGNITLVGAGEIKLLRQTDNTCAPFTDCITEINNTQVDNTKDLDIVMAMLI